MKVYNFLKAYIGIDMDVDGDFEYIESVAFDEGNKVYSFSIVNPEPGYIYRLRWEK